MVVRLLVVLATTRCTAGIRLLSGVRRHVIWRSVHALVRSHLMVVLVVVVVVRRVQAVMGRQQCLGILVGFRVGCCR